VLVATLTLLVSRRRSKISDVDFDHVVRPKRYERDHPARIKHHRGLRSIKVLQGFGQGVAFGLFRDAG
jgi:hypothetical protein